MAEVPRVGRSRAQRRSSRGFGLAASSHTTAIRWLEEVMAEDRRHASIESDITHAMWQLDGTAPALSMVGLGRRFVAAWLLRPMPQGDLKLNTR